MQLNKRCGRYEIDLTQSTNAYSGIQTLATRKGLVLFGWYDQFVGIEGYTISWDELDKAREMLKKPKNGGLKNE